MSVRAIRWAFGPVFLILVALAGCRGAALPPGPDLHLQSPQDGMQIPQGGVVPVQSLAIDETNGVLKVELWVDGRLYQVDRAPSEEGLPQFSAVQMWEALVPGEHRIRVRAFNGVGGVSESPEVRILVLAPTPTPTTIPRPEATPTASACVPDAKFVEDVTIPDDTIISPGASFEKTWRLQNNGECAWEEGTTWAFISGDPLGASPSVEVPPVEPGEEIDITVKMTAPMLPGTYTSYWQLRRPSGELFGDQAYVRIQVP